MTSIADRIGLGNEVREFRLGRSFGNSGSSSFHSIRYDFKPASVDTTKMAAVDIGEKNQVAVTVPHIEGSGTAHTIFKGSKKPSQKECVLIIDHSTGEITLEKLNCNIQLKKTRAESASKFRSSTPVDHNSRKLSPPPPSKHSPPQKMSHSPNQKSLWLNQTYHSPTQKSPSKNHRSPTSQPSPSMPCLVPPNSTSRSSKEVCMAVITNEDSTEMREVPEMSESSSSESSSSAASSTSGSSDSESDNEKQHPQAWSHPSGPANGTSCGSTGSHPHAANILPSMPHFSQLSEDLQLSESGSESD